MKRSTCFLVRAIVIILVLIDCTVADLPNFVSGFGLNVISSTKVKERLYEVVVSTDNVRGNQAIRILVPRDYETSGTSRRYPVLHLLHGAYGNARQWTTFLEAQVIVEDAPLIAVMPNGDPYGYYTNWVLPGDLAPQQWRTFHMEQVVPWIDLNLRTVAKKQGRAIAGLSMGGFGAMHYTELYSQNFTYGASFSGTLDLLNPLVQDIIISIPGPGKPLIGPFGYPKAPVGSNGWISEDTITHADKVQNMSIAIYTGNTGPLESTLRDGSYRLRDALVSHGIPVYFDDYGNGKSIGHGCDGAHSFPCWNAALIDVLPRMLAVLEQQH